MKINTKFCKNLFFTKLTHKYGISLITLAITIIVIIILAAAVVMSLNNNNVLTNASSARYETDRDSMQSYLELAIQKVTLRHQGTLLLDSGEVAMDATSNVKDSKGTITWKSTDIGNLSGQIIFDKGYSSTNDNMRAVSYLLDKVIWTDKFKGNGAEYVVGGPSLDMVLTSYNQYTNPYKWTVLKNH